MESEQNNEYFFLNAVLHELSHLAHYQKLKGKIWPRDMSRSQYHFPYLEGISHHQKIDSPSIVISGQSKHFPFFWSHIWPRDRDMSRLCKGCRILVTSTLRYYLCLPFHLIWEKSDKQKTRSNLPGWDCIWKCKSFKLVSSQQRPQIDIV